MKSKSLDKNSRRKDASKRPEVSAEGLKMLNLDLQLCFALYATSRAMTNAYRPILKSLDLTYPQYLVMLVLWQQDGVSIGALGERLHLDSGTGVERFDAHRLYHGRGYSIYSHHFARGV